MATNKWKQIVPQDFQVPLDYLSGAFVFRPLGVRDIEEDYQAVMSNVKSLKNTFCEFFPEWPAENLTKEEDLANLGWHQTEFAMKSSFAYLVRDSKDMEYVGCVYFFPSIKDGYEVDIYVWVVKDRKEQESDLVETVKNWVKDVWHFNMVRFPGRD